MKDHRSKIIDDAKTIGMQDKKDPAAKRVDFKEKVSVYSTDKDKYHKTGAEMKVTPLQAEDLLKRGLVSKEPTESKKDAFDADKEKVKAPAKKDEGDQL